LDPNTTLLAGTVQASRGTVTSGNGDGDTAVAIAIGNISGGSSVTISFRVKINDSLPIGTQQIENQGIVSSTNQPPVSTDDPTVPGDSNPTSTPVSDLPLLTLIKEDSLLADADEISGVSSGDSLLYLVKITNRGNVAATNVLFADTPDANTILVNGTVQTSQGTVTSGNSAGDSSIGVTVGTIPAGQSVAISFLVTIGPTADTSVLNQASVERDEVPADGPSGVAAIPSDDPATENSDDATITPVQPAPTALGEIDEPDAVQSVTRPSIFLPLINR
jgi:uncharacterized repeat protein (TIGR01451 family)